MSVYREAGEAPCHHCDRPAREVCECCQRPTCDRHRDAKRMCGKCDEAFYRHMKAEDSLVGWALPLLMVAAVSLGLFAPPLLPVAVAVPFLGFPAMLVLRKRQRRARFFRLMRERGALPQPKSDITDEDVALAKYEAQVHDRHLATFEHAADVNDAPDR